MNIAKLVFKRSVPITALLLCFAFSIRAQDAEKKADEYLNALVKLNRFSGSILIAKDGKTVIARGYGMANIETDTPNAPQTIFRLGSITKQFTATAIMKLQEQGKLNVQEPICKYLSDCPSAWQPVSIRHLLTHTSGIANYTDFPGVLEAATKPTPPSALAAGFKDKPLEFPPGEKFKYSNSGYHLMGLIIEKASGKSYEEFLRETVFEPLGMKNTGYDSNTKIIRNRAAGYRSQGDDFVNANYIHMSVPYSAGALYSTVEDLLLWDQALYTEKILSGKSLEEMFAPFKGNYGYGWVVGAFANRKFTAHDGGIPGFSTSIARYPDDKVCIIVLSNIENANAGKINRDLAAIMFGEKYEVPRERKIAAVNPAIYDAYVGEYELAPTFILTVTREGDKLMTQATGQQKIEIFPESDTVFFPKVIEAEISFVKDESGKTTHLVLRQAGREMPAKKIK